MAEHNSNADHAKSPKSLSFPTQQVFLLIVGALIGLIPVMYQVELTALSQRQQLRFDRQLEAIKDFSGALNDYSQLLEKDGELEDFLTYQAGSRVPEAQFTKFQSLLRESTLLRNQYIAHLHTESVVMSSVFPHSFKVLDYLDLNLPSPNLSLKGKSSKELRKLLRQGYAKIGDLLRNQDALTIKSVGDYDAELHIIGELLTR